MDHILNSPALKDLPNARLHCAKEICLPGVPYILSLPLPPGHTQGKQALDFPLKMASAHFHALGGDLLWVCPPKVSPCEHPQERRVVVMDRAWIEGPADHTRVPARPHVGQGGAMGRLRRGWAAPFVLLSHHPTNIRGRRASGLMVLLVRL